MTLIDNWRQWPRLWSVRYPLLGAMLVGLAEQLPEAFAYAWAALPTDVVATLPPEYVRVVGVVLVVLGTFLRMVKQTNLHKDEP